MIAKLTVYKGFLIIVLSSSQWLDFPGEKMLGRGYNQRAEEDMRACQAEIWPCKRSCGGTEVCVTSGQEVRQVTADLDCLTPVHI